MKENGFVRVGALVNKLYLGNVIENAKEISKEIKKAYKSGISILVSPELSLTGYTCGDMFLQDKLISDSLEGLKYLLDQTKRLNIISIIGMPILVNNQLYNCGVVISKGKILGIVPKTYIPNYKEFYEMAKERIDKAKYQDKLNNESYNSTASYNEYYITCLPWTDFISMTHPIPEDKSSQTVPRVCWGKYIENNGKYEISLNITVSHVFVDGYHLSKVFNNVQELLNDTTNVLK